MNEHPSRDFRGPVVVVPLQPMPTADEAAVLLATLLGRQLHWPLGRVNVVMAQTWSYGWFDSRGDITPRGGDALAAYLLRGWRA